MNHEQKNRLASLLVADTQEAIKRNDRNWKRIKSNNFAIARHAGVFKLMCEIGIKADEKRRLA